MSHTLKQTCLAVLLVTLFSGTAHAVLSIRITQGVEGALPIAVVPFGWSGPQSGPPQPVGEIVANDLKRSGQFAPISLKDLPSRPHHAAEVNFADWRVLGTNNLVIGNVSVQPNGEYQVQFRLFDVYRGQQLAGLQYEVPASALRRTAHQISDVIYQKLTGERGAFDTRIAYVREWKAADGKNRWALSVADSDGYGAHDIVESKQPILSPDWSPDGRRIAYVSFENHSSNVFIQNLATGSRADVAHYPGINSAPAFSPDGKRLALTLSKDGNPEVYILYLDSNRLQRLTNSIGIDTEAAWAPDGKSLIFTSDRGGSPQIYRIPATGGQATRITFQGSYNARATFSPDGKKIAFVHRMNGAFRIALLDLQNNAMQVLTNSQLDESPSFAPNGSMIIYATTDSEGVSLAEVSVDGRFRQRLVEQSGVELREPAWSPFRRGK